MGTIDFTKGNDAEGIEQDIKWAVRTPAFGQGGHCGYAQIPEGHPWRGRKYDDIPAEVWDGLTYGIDGLYNTNDDGWIGFDHSHFNDPQFEGGEPFTIEHVAEEARDLARQIATAGRSNS